MPIEPHVPFREAEEWFVKNGANEQKAADLRIKIADLVSGFVVPMLGPVPVGLTGIINNGQPSARIDIISEGSSLSDLPASVRNEDKFRQTGVLNRDCRRYLMEQDTRPPVEIAFVNPSDWGGRSPDEIAQLMRTRGEMNIGIFWANYRLPE